MHQQHWSGAHCHECFIEQVIAEAHPLDAEFATLTREYYERMFAPPAMRDVLPAHYKNIEVD